jgi:acetoin utilization deacetylase AcuC-like enzyme
MTDALLLSDPRFSQHRCRGYHPERPERIDAARAAVVRAEQEAGLAFASVAPRPATEEELGRVHSPEFIASLSALRGKDAHLDPDTFLGPDSVDVAELAAGGILALTDALLDGPVRQGIALVRPPGHHARPNGAMGFCLYNNAALAAAHARARGLSRIAVIDWDVHHGNGTQEAFYADPGVLYVSTHQYPLYPGTGAALETGVGDGRGFTINVPLSAGGGDGVYRGAFERIVLPALAEYRPELVLVSAGFDASLRDPLAEMALSAEAFGWMARALRQVAENSAKGRMLLTLEGGYDLVSLEAGLFSAMLGMTREQATDIARDVDHADIGVASRAAKQSWSSVDQG